jgi:hypothetical protein
MIRQFVLAFLLMLSFSMMGQKTWKDYGLVPFEETKDSVTLYGLKNQAGLIILPAKYENFQAELTEGYALNFSVKGGPFKDNELKALNKAKKLEWLTGLIDSTGKVVVVPSYEEIQLPFTQNITIVEKDGLYGLISKKGVVLTPDFEPEMFLLGSYPYFLVKSKSKKGLINLKGEKVIPVEFDTIAEDAYSYEQEEMFYCEVGNAGKWGLYSVKGKSLIIPVAYDNLSRRADDFVILENQKKFGLFDLRKKLQVIPVIYSGINAMYEPFVTVIKEGKSGLINIKTQKTLVPCLYKGYFRPVFYEATASSEKLAGYFVVEEIGDETHGNTEEGAGEDEEDYYADDENEPLERMGFFDANGKLLLNQVYVGDRYSPGIHIFHVTPDLMLGWMKKGSDTDSTYCIGYWVLNLKTLVFKSSTPKYKRVIFNDDAPLNVMVQTMEGKWGLINSLTDKYLVEPMPGECNTYDDEHVFTITDGEQSRTFNYLGKEIQP